MKKKLLPGFFLFFVFVIHFVFFAPTFILAEDKNIQDSGFAGMIPKLPKTPDDPELFNNFVYPSWGPVCQRYTYTVTYKDKEGRSPEYMRIIFNGKIIEMEPALDESAAGEENYKNGVRYEYKFVPNKLGSNFYYFEASNGLGKTRAAIIDSPDNGPVLFDSAFDKNEIALIDAKSGKKILSYPTGKEWVGQVALSDNGKYLAAQTSYRVLLFDTDSLQKPLWEWKADETSQIIGGDMKGGVAISGDGSTIAATVGNKVLLFNKASNKPLWEYETPAFKVAISRDGKYLAAAVLKDNPNGENNFLILWKKEGNKPLWEFSNDSNFHDVTLSDDGAFISTSTGCPDRKAYIFSRDSNTPLLKSERLTYDSPVSRSKITADGLLAAYSTEGGPDSSVVVLFSRASSTPLWKFDNGKRNSSRALSITSDGKFIAAATMAGDVYLLNKEKNTPFKSWQINASIGALDLSNDGSVLAIGGTDKKIHILSKDTQLESTVDINEYIDNLDVSANGKYVAVGTGGAVYFFEDYISPAKNKVFPCTTIIEPKPLVEAMGGNNGQAQQSNSSLCGDGKCEGPETIESCKQDCDPSFKTTARKPIFKDTQIKLPGMLFVFGFLLSAMLLGIFTALRKFKFLEKQKIILGKFNMSKLSFLKLTGKKVTIFLSIFTVIFLLLTIITVFINKDPGEVLLKPAEQPKSVPGKVIMNDNKEGVINQGKTESGCGNTVCEPVEGETKESCPKDCSANN